MHGEAFEPLAGRDLRALGDEAVFLARSTARNVHGDARVAGDGDAAEGERALAHQLVEHVAGRAAGEVRPAAPGRRAL